MGLYWICLVLPSFCHSVIQSLRNLSNENFSSHFSQELWGLEDWNLVHMWTVGRCIVYTGIRLLLLIHPFISSFFFLSNFQLLYPRHLCRGVYSFRLSVRPFVCSFVLPSRSWNYFKVLCSSNSSGVYLTNHSSECIHIWTIGTLEGWLSFHDSSPQGPCPGVGIEVKI